MFKKIYLVKKDPNKDSKDNWQIMSGNEFTNFISSEDGQRRKANFYKLNACNEHDVIVYVECNQECGKQIKRMTNEEDYHRNLKKGTVTEGLTVF